MILNSEITDHHQHFEENKIDLTDDYWVFCNEYYYPSTGLKDLVRTFKTYDVALSYCEGRVGCTCTIFSRKELKSTCFS